MATPVGVDQYNDRRKVRRYFWLMLASPVAWSLIMNVGHQDGEFWLVCGVAATIFYGLKWHGAITTPIDLDLMLFQAQDPNGIRLYRKMMRRFWGMQIWFPFAGVLGNLINDTWAVTKLAAIFCGFNYAFYWEAKRQLAQLRPMELLVSRSETEESTDNELTDRFELLSPLEFEALTGMLLTRMGYQVKTTPVTGDGGVDLVAYDPTPIKGGYVVVQCKHTAVVGSPEVRDLYGAMTHHGANKGILVTSGRFSQQAQDWAAGKPIELIDGVALAQLIREHR